ncbi:hypothetical protein F5Y09DRAFT_356895 [Xylaria sp. FL1042]|nr:hypothetical protein F5Y09DRAFT_356895 [Xylaria sp. FL1042]
MNRDWIDNGSFALKRKWITPRGDGSTIEHQCVKCHYMFDTFDLERDKCYDCESPVKDEEKKAPRQPEPTSPVQQNEVSQLTSSPQIETGTYEQFAPAYAPSGSTQYQTYGQEFGTTYNSPYLSETMSSPTGGLFPSQFLGQQHGVSPSISHSSDIMSPPVGGYYDQNQTYEQAYNMPPNSCYLPATTPDALGVYQPSQTSMQEYNNMSSPPSSYLETAAYPPQGYAPNPAQGHTPNLSQSTSGQS